MIFSLRPLHATAYTLIEVALGIAIIGILTTFIASQNLAWQEESYAKALQSAHVQLQSIASQSESLLDKPADCTELATAFNNGSGQFDLGTPTANSLTIAIKGHASYAVTFKRPNACGNVCIESATGFASHAATPESKLECSAETPPACNVLKRTP